MATDRPWREQLDSLLAKAPGWIDDGEGYRYGLPADESAVRQAARFLEAMGEYASPRFVRVSLEPEGHVCMAWYGESATLVAWAEAGIISDMIGYYPHSPAGKWDLDNHNPTFEGAVTAARAWLDENP